MTLCLLWFPSVNGDHRQTARPLPEAVASAGNGRYQLQVNRIRKDRGTRSAEHQSFHALPVDSERTIPANYIARGYAQLVVL